MRYLYLSEIGDSLNNEEGTSGVRMCERLWANKEASLKAAIVTLNHLLQKAKPARPSVKSLIQNYESMSTSSRMGGAYAGTAALSGRPGAAYGSQVVSDDRNRGVYTSMESVSGPKPTSSEIEEARKVVEHYRAWFKREMVDIDENGNVNYKTLGQLTVVYDHDPDVRNKTRIYFGGGLLYIDAACTKLLDTSHMVTHFSGPGKAIFVMDKHGNIHVDSHIAGHRHHSSLVAGRKIACGGELEVTRGKLVWMSNKSGHYWPKKVHLLQILHQLQKKEVPMNFKVTIMTPSQQFNSVGDFLRELELEGKPDYELNKLLTYSYWLKKPDILQANNWRWYQKASGETKGVYELNTGRKVAHQQVRKWLKQQGRKPDSEIQYGDGR